MISALAFLGALATTLLCLSFYSTNLYIMERRRSEEETSLYAADLVISKARLDAILCAKKQRSVWLNHIRLLLTSCDPLLPHS
jgi:hypothetical protein